MKLLSPEGIFFNLVGGELYSTVLFTRSTPYLHSLPWTATVFDVHTVRSLLYSRERTDPREVK